MVDEDSPESMVDEKSPELRRWESSELSQNRKLLPSNHVEPFNDTKDPLESNISSFEYLHVKYYHCELVRKHAMLRPLSMLENPIWKDGEKLFQICILTLWKF